MKKQLASVMIPTQAMSGVATDTGGRIAGKTALQPASDLVTCAWVLYSR